MLRDICPDVKRKFLLMNTTPEEHCEQRMVDRDIWQGCFGKVDVPVVDISRTRKKRRVNSTLHINQRIPFSD